MPYISNAPSDSRRGNTLTRTVNIKSSLYSNWQFWSVKYDFVLDTSDDFVLDTCDGNPGTAK